MKNTQITGEEVTCVWKNIHTGKILGFAPANWNFPGMQHCISLPLMHAHEMDYWANEFRKQQQEEFEEKQYAQFVRDSEVRKRIKDQLLARRNVVGPLQRADIDRGLKMIETMEKRISQRTQEGALLVEMYDSSKRKEDIALEAPAYQTPKVN